MTLRMQLPVRPPLPLRAVWSGAAAWLRGGAAATGRVAGVLAERYGARQVMLLDSGTSALTLALRAGGAGSIVALPAWCCYDVATAALGAGARVALYDVDPATLTPDLSSLRAALGRGATTVVVAALYGLAPPWDELRKLCADAGALVIEDAAQAAGGRFHDRLLGTFGSLVVLSFGRGKGATGGRGGALLALDEAGERALAAHGAGPGRSSGGFKEIAALFATWLLGRPSLYGVPASLPFLGLGQTHFREPGAVAGMSSVCGGTLEVTLGLDTDELAARRRRAEQLAALVARSGAGTPARAVAGAEPGWLRLPVLAGPALRRAVADGDARRLGVLPAYPRVLGELPRFRDLVVNADAATPGARALAEALVTMPTHSGVSDADVRELERWLAGAA